MTDATDNVGKHLGKLKKTIGQRVWEGIKPLKMRPRYCRLPNAGKN